MTSSLAAGGAFSLPLLDAIGGLLNIFLFLADLVLGTGDLGPLRPKGPNDPPEPPERNRVRFTFPAEYVGAAPSNHVLAVAGTTWLVPILIKVEGLQVARKYQENRGVYYEVAREGRTFSVRVSAEGKHHWLIQFGLCGLFHRRSESRAALIALLREVHKTLKAEPEASEVRWYSEAELSGPDDPGRAEPPAW